MSADAAAVDGLWCLPAGPIPDDLGKDDAGELVALPDGIELRSPAMTLRMSPIRGFTSGSIKRKHEQNSRMALVVDYGEPVGKRVYVVVRSDFNPVPKLGKVDQMLRAYVPESALELGPFKEGFLEPPLVITFPFHSLAELRLSFSNDCVGCLTPTDSRMEVPWFLRMERGPGQYTEWGWPLVSVPVCLQCHRFGLFTLLAIELERSPTGAVERVLVRLPNIASHEAFRDANHLDRGSWLILRGSAARKGAIGEEEAAAAIAPHLEKWRRLNERIGLHRYLRRFLGKSGASMSSLT